MKIAILGSNGQIAKGLINKFIEQECSYLYLYSTNITKTYNFMNQFNSNSFEYDYYSYKEFNKYDYDVIINCIGAGTISKLNSYHNYFTFPEEYDNLCINYIKENSNTLYITFSSGVIYGELNDIADEDTKNKISVNNIEKQKFYSISKLYSESKHRSLENLNIIDLRIFSYFSKYIDLSDSYFITDIINAIRNNKKLNVVNDSFIRDYLCLDDLFQAVIKCISVKKLNCAIDIVSKEPVEKFKILNFYKENYNLEYEINNDFKYNCSTGNKNIYSSKFNKAKHIIDYKSLFSSMETIIDSSKYLLEDK